MADEHGSTEMSIFTYLKDYEKGCLVSAHYDGKSGRGTDCRVIRRRGFAILVEFVPWHFENKGKPIQKWFVGKTIKKNVVRPMLVYSAYVSEPNNKGVQELLGYTSKGEYYSLHFKG